MLISEPRSEFFGLINSQPVHRLSQRVDRINELVAVAVAALVRIFIALVIKKIPMMRIIHGMAIQRNSNNVMDYYKLFCIL